MRPSRSHSWRVLQKALFFQLLQHHPCRMGADGEGMPNLLDQLKRLESRQTKAEQEGLAKPSPGFLQWMETIGSSRPSRAKRSTSLLCQFNPKFRQNRLERF